MGARRVERGLDRNRLLSGALWEGARRGMLKPGDIAVLAAAGTGYTWSAAVVRGGRFDVAKAKVSEGIELWYEESGQGAPVLFISGLGYWHWCWFRQVPFLSRSFRVITFDNRGVGESDKPDVPYSVELFARDTADLVRGLGYDRVHVVGHSMGGMIAQELALTAPDLVDGLVLVGSTPGGAARVLPDPQALGALRPDPDLTHEQNMRQAFPTAVAPGYFDHHPDEMDEMVKVRMSKPTPLYAYHRQLAAGAGWPGTAGRLGGIQSPTLVVHGDQDLLVPPANGERLAELIPDAELCLLPGTGHLPFIEAAPMFNRVLGEFLGSL